MAVIEKGRVEEFRARLEEARRRIEEERQRRAEISERLVEAVRRARLGLVAEMAGECRPTGYGYFCKARAGRIGFGVDTYSMYVDLAVDGQYIGYVGRFPYIEDYDRAEQLARLLENLPDEYYELAELLKEAMRTDRELAREIAKEMIRILANVG